MITPLDIQNKMFTRVVRGYKEEEVDEFLDLVTLDYEKVLTENKALKDQMKKLTSEVEKYKGSEGTVYETLEAAKALMIDISSSAEKRAEMVLKNAEIEAEIIQREAKESVEKLHEEYANMKASLTIFKTRYKTLLEGELEKFDILSSELFTDKDIFENRNTTFFSEDMKTDKSPQVSKNASEKASKDSMFVNKKTNANTIKLSKGERE